MFRPGTVTGAYTIGLRRPNATLECYRVQVTCPSRVRVDEAFITTASVTAVGWGAQKKPNVALQLSGAGMEIDPRTALQASSMNTATRSIRWSVKPLSKGRFSLVFNVASTTHPLEFIGSDGVFPIEVYAPWTAVISPYTGALLTFFGSLATLPGILQWRQQRREKAASGRP